MIEDKMPRPEWGIYHDGNHILFRGYRKPIDPETLTWAEITDPNQRETLTHNNRDDLEWSGRRVVHRSKAELDLRETVEALVRDDAYFEREEVTAILSLLLDEINLLRERQALPPRTMEEAKLAYQRKLNRI